MDRPLTYLGVQSEDIAKAFFVEPSTLTIAASASISIVLFLTAKSYCDETHFLEAISGDFNIFNKFFFHL